MTSTKKQKIIKEAKIVKKSSSKAIKLTPSFWARRANRKAEKNLQKENDRKIVEKLKIATEKSEQKAEIKAKHEAVSKMSLQDLENVIKSSTKRRSSPLATLFFVLIIAGLAGAAVWQYRDTEISNIETANAELENSAKTFKQEQQNLEAAKKAEEDKFVNITAANYSVRIPKDWSEKPSQFPIEEKIYGDNNVTFKIIDSESRNSIEQFVPKLDYLWQIDSSDSSNVKVTNQSLHCDRFDTLTNDLSSGLKEHNGFSVYCDNDSEKVVIAALATPEKYGLKTTNNYFIIEINDIQQVNLEDIRTYLQSFKTL